MFFFKQAPALDQRAISEDQICFSTLVNGARVYGSVPDKDEYARYILSSKDGSDYANELLWTDTHTYVDLDAPCTLDDLGHTLETFVAAFNHLLIESFAKHLDCEIRPHQILWSNSSRPEKTSFHIKIACDQYWQVSQRKEMKSFFKLVNQVCLQTKGFHFYTTVDDELKLSSILDLSVYSANRCFRSLNCQKPDSPKLLPLSGRVSHSLIVAHMLTVTQIEGMKPFVLKSKCQIPKIVASIHTGILQDLAAKYGATYIETKGSLCLLRNKGCRICPINNERNTSDNCFFLLKEQGSKVLFGCHNESCKGQLIPVHTFQTVKEYTYYEDYMKLVNKGSQDLKRADIEEYLKSTISYIDRPDQPYFVTLSKVGLPCFDHKINASQVHCSKTLFQRYADIHLIADSEEEPLKFSAILSQLLKQRRIPTYCDTLWQPCLGTSPHVPVNKLNTFQGFCLSTVKSEGIDFEKTVLFNLLERLCGHQQEYINYLCSFIGAKLQRPYIKVPIALCFLNSKEGCGKGSFAKFLERLFSCGETSFISFNNLQSFANGFNQIQSKSLWIVLEEISAKRNCLKEFRGFLKDKISATSLLCEPKGKERSLIPFYGSLILFSNEFNVLSCSKNDRRLCMFTSDSSKANDRDFFVALYAELDNLAIMRSAFDYFSKYDVSEFDYRAIPYSEIKDKLAQCSEKNVTKFHRWLLKTQYREECQFEESEVYHYYKEFCEIYGVGRPSDRSHVCTQLELYLPMQKVDETYYLSQANRDAYYAEIRH